METYESDIRDRCSHLEKEIRAAHPYMGKSKGGEGCAVVRSQQCINGLCSVQSFQRAAKVAHSNL